MALYNAASDAARRYPQLMTLLAASIDRSDFAKYFERCRTFGLMQFDDAEEMASMFTAMAQGEWPRRIAYGILPRMTEEQIDTQARLATAMFLKAVAPEKENK